MLDLLPKLPKAKWHDGWKEHKYAHPSLKDYSKRHENEWSITNTIEYRASDNEYDDVEMVPVRKAVWLGPSPKPEPKRKRQPKDVFTPALRSAYEEYRAMMTQGGLTPRTPEAWLAYHLEFIAKRKKK